MVPFGTIGLGLVALADAWHLCFPFSISFSFPLLPLGSSLIGSGTSYLLHSEYIPEKEVCWGVHLATCTTGDPQSRGRSGQWEVGSVPNTGPTHESLDFVLGSLSTL